MICTFVHFETPPLGHNSFRVMVVFAPEVPLEAKDVDVLDIDRDPDKDS